MNDQLARNFKSKPVNLNRGVLTAGLLTSGVDSSLLGGAVLCAPDASLYQMPAAPAPVMTAKNVSRHSEMCLGVRGRLWVHTMGLGGSRSVDGTQDRVRSACLSCGGTDWSFNCSLWEACKGPGKEVSLVQGPGWPWRLPPLPGPCSVLDGPGRLAAPLT